VQPKRIFGNSAALLAMALRNPMRDTRFDPEKFAKIMARDPAPRRFVIFFTPRSGSSRINDLARQTRALGRPGELFNPELMTGIGQSVSARNRAEYVQLVLRQLRTGDVFGCQATYMHIVLNFGTGGRFLRALRPAQTIWLIRQDIVAQAVSISRMMQTRQSHSVYVAPADLAAAESRFAYEPAVIHSALRRLRWMERRTEALIARADLTPLRLSYEQSIALPPEALMQAIAEHVGAGPLPGGALETGHKKMSGSRSADFAARFRAENVEMIARIDADRAAMLAALDRRLAPGALPGVTGENVP